MIQIPSSEAKAALLHGAMDPNELLIFNPREVRAYEIESHSWTTFFCSGLLRQAVFLT